MPTLARRIWKWFAFTLAGAVILLAALVGAFRIVMEHVPEYRTQIAAWVSERIGVDVTFGSIDARWRLYGPELAFSDAALGSRDRSVVLARARRGSVGFDVIESLRTGHLMAGRVSLEGPVIALEHTAAGRIEIIGSDLAARTPRRQAFDLDRLPTGRLEITDAVVSYVDRTRPGTSEQRFEHVSFELQRAVGSVRLAGTVPLPATLGRELEFKVRTRGRLNEPQALEADFEVAVADLDLAGWASVLPQNWNRVQAGRGQLQLAGRLHGRDVVALRGKVDLAAVAIKLPSWSMPLPAPAPMEQPEDYPPEPSALPRPPAEPAHPDPARFQPPPTADVAHYDRLAMHFDAARDAEGGRLDVRDLVIARAGRPWPASTLTVAWRGPLEDPQSAQGRVSYFAPQAVVPLLAYAPEQPLFARLRAADPGGELHNIDFELNREPSRPLSYTLEGRFDGLASHAFEKVPGVAGLSGTFAANEFGGRVEIDASAPTIDLPCWYLEPVGVTRATGTVTWRRTDMGWHILSDEVVLEAPHGHARGSFEITIPGDGTSPTVDVVASASDVDARAVPPFIPVGRLRPRTVEWLTNAFVAGRAPGAQLELRGPAHAFPFSGGEGEFVVRANIVDATLDYAPGFAPLTGASGAIEFHNQGLAGTATTGRIGKLRVRSGSSFSIADVRDPVVVVKGRGRGDLADGLAYLAASPLGPRLGALFARLEAQGVADFDVRLELPVRHASDSTFRIGARIDDARVTLAEQPLVATNVRGAFRIVDGGFASDGLEGQLLGGGFRLVSTAGKASPGMRPGTQFDASGTLAGQALAAAYGVPATVALGGSTGWRLTGTIDPSEHGTAPQQHYHLTSDLVGFEPGLPAPLTRADGLAGSLTAELDYGGADDALLRVSTDRGRAVAKITRHEGPWQFDRGGVRFDGVTPAMPDLPGLTVEGNVDRFALDEWLALRSDAPGNGPQLRDWLTAANVRVATLGLWGYEFADVRGTLRRAQSGWSVDVVAPDARGHVDVPYDSAGTEPLNLDLESLVVHERAPSARGRGEADPRRMPAIDARIADLTWGRFHFGRTRAQLTHDENGLTVDSMTARGGSYSAEASGSWRVLPGTGESMHVDLAFTSTDVQATLKDLGYENALTGKRGFLRANLDWPGSLDENFLARSSGDMRFEIEDGQVINVQPGAGRVLGLLSIAALPRRLALDFSDLTDKGLAFDSISGDFELRSGSAYTDNLLLRGPAAEIGIAGRTDIASHEYAQTAVVTGNLGASLGVAGALAGGPAVGAALLLFSQIFKEPLKGMTRGYYRITGKWEDPVIERLLTSEGEGESRAAQAEAERPTSAR
jgi:uncharacterized protein (TIGR02099 family)